MPKGRSFRKRLPFGVKALSVASYIISIVFLVAGISFIIGAFYGIEVAPETFNQIIENLAISSSSFIIVSALAVTGIVFFALSVLCFFIAHGLWCARSWARVAAIITLIFAALSAFAEVRLLPMIIYILIIAYLLFSQNVKKSFST